MKSYVLAKLNKENNFEILCLNSQYLKKQYIRRDSNMENNWKTFKSIQSAQKAANDLDNNYNVFDINDLSSLMYKYDNSGVSETRVLSHKLNEYCNGQTYYHKTKQDAINDGINWINERIKECENEIKEQLNFINEYKSDLEILKNN